MNSKFFFHSFRALGEGDVFFKLTTYRTEKNSSTNSDPTKQVSPYMKKKHTISYSTVRALICLTLHWVSDLAGTSWTPSNLTLYEDTTGSTIYTVTVRCYKHRV